ncbi:MAG: adenosylmethionine decarboxylase [Bdellovibrionaceae bacterium]|nr:hypothetical protein [Bdellovibrionales bacterium]MCB9084342.1 adenosylmethionine decarboxylase [Pseudobdellovibrionaceae bacterium]
MLFEGSEKKVEIVVRPGLPSFRDKSRKFWDEIVDAAGACILSEVHSSACDAYLLSESSLFVFDQRVVMITCGKTTLVSAALNLVDEVGKASLQSLIYQRKNEYFPDQQHSQFHEDVLFLEGKLNGRSLCLGDPNSHHMHVYHLNEKFFPVANDTTTEILMYDLGEDIRQIFSTPGLTAEQIRLKTGMSEILGGFSIDDWAFDPVGYSLNAVKDDLYYTIHVTPEESATYASFETNLPTERDLSDLVARVLTVFRPQKFDVVGFRPEGACQLRLPGVESYQREIRDLECGYSLTFGAYRVNVSADSKSAM